MFFDSISDMESESAAIKFGNYFKEISESFFERAKEIRQENEEAV